MTNLLIKYIITFSVSFISSFALIAGYDDESVVQTPLSSKENKKIKKEPVKKICQETLAEFKKSLEFSINKYQEENFLAYLIALHEEIKIDSQELSDEIDKILTNVTKENFNHFFIDSIVNQIKKTLEYNISETEEKEFKRLLSTLIFRKIMIRKTLYGLILKVNKKYFLSFCINANHFFQNLSFVMPCTGVLATILDKQTRHIKDFTERNFGELAYIAALKTLPCFIAMYSSQGFPHQKDIEDMFLWPEWKINGKFNDQLLKYISFMYQAKGLPQRKEVQDILAYPQWKIDDQLDINILKKFSLYHHRGKGYPQISQVEEFLLKFIKSDFEPTIESMQKYLQYKLNKEQKEELSMLFNTLQNKKIDINKTFYKLLICVKKENFYKLCKQLNNFYQYSSDLIKNTSSLTNIFCKNRTNIIDFSERSFEEVSYIASLETFPFFSPIYHGKKFPKREYVENMLTWEYWKKSDGSIDVKRLQSFVAFYKKNDLPKKSDVEKFFYESKGVSFQPTVESIQNNLDYQLSSMQKQNISRVFEKLQSKDIEIKKTFYELLIVVPKEIMNSFCMNVCCFWENISIKKKNTSLFTSLIGKTKKKIIHFSEKSFEEIIYILSHELFPYLISMYHSRGFPNQEDIQRIYSWPQWRGDNNKFSIERFKSFAYSYGSKGCPTKKDVDEFFLKYNEDC